ncbi:Capsular polysaccharide biosynthesis protein [Methylobacterium phyllostachyos]|uniref:Capsular polysaccharide biosynthesis protein n=2 Tax=Methylobacterium phyllostachyos TaxID=582672 RepID=A0A1H0KCW4_9HYPH|nr:Capsular polysaccharide biosynthesis protein [Methylobacterium phyllostachyos]
MMGEAFRQILVQAAQSGTQEGLEALERALSAAEPSDVAAQHLATLGFRFESEDRVGLAAQAYALAARVARSRAPRYRLAAIRARILDLCGRDDFDPVEPLLDDLQQAKTAAEDPGRADPSFVDLGWACEMHGEVERAVRFYLLARIARDHHGGAALTHDGDTFEVKIKNLRRLQFDALLAEGRFDEAIELHKRTGRVHGSAPLAAYEIVGVKALAEAGEASYVEILPGRRIEAPALKFWEPPPPLLSEPGDLDMPPLYLAFLQEAHAFPRSNVVVKGDRVVYDVAAHPRRKDILIQDGVNLDQIMMAAFGRTRALIEIPENAERIEAGLVMFGLQSRNYGHWFSEFVPRMLCYNDPRCPDGIPLCIDDHMPGTHEEILSLLDTRNRPVIKLPPRPVSFGTLGMAPVPAFFPFDMKPRQTFYDTIWPADIFGMIRERILERARERGVLSERNDRRLFISRKAFTQRVLENEQEVADRLRPLGFEVIYPETLSFLEQVALFHSAALVVGSSNSSLNNALFARPGCQILGLIHEDLSFNFRGYTSYVEAGGAQITFLRGKSSARKDNVHAFHANYRVDPKRVTDAVAQLTMRSPALAGCIRT